MNRLIFLAGAILTLSLSSCQQAGNTVQTEDGIRGYTDKEAIENILARKSVRKFTGQSVEQEKIDLLVRAGMAAPSAMDRRPWEIVVLNEREALDALADQLPNSEMIRTAPLVIVVCGDQERSTFWYIDCSAVTQNILLAAEALDLGAVWTGAYPANERAELISQALGLPENIKTVALIPVGYPDGDFEAKDKFDQNKVHYNRW